MKDESLFVICLVGSLTVVASVICMLVMFADNQHAKHNMDCKSVNGSYVYLQNTGWVCQ